MKEMPIIDPHSVVHFLLEQAGLEMPRLSLQQFWQHHSQFGAAWAQGVEFDRIPIGLFGDAARVNTKFGTVNIASIFLDFCLWKPRSTRCSRFMLFSVPEHELWHSHTLNRVFQRITWSINSLIEGFHPSVGPYGESLPMSLQHLSGQPYLHRCKLVEIRGDWSWHKKIFIFPGVSWVGKKMCHHCHALSSSTDAAKLYWNYDANDWQEHPFDFPQFINERMPATHICFLPWFPMSLLCPTGDFCLGALQWHLLVDTSWKT